MIKFSFIYLVFIYLLFAVYTYFGDINFEYQIIGCFLLIILFGIPHGAIDHIVYKTQNNISNINFGVISDESASILAATKVI